MGASLTDIKNLLIEKSATKQIVYQLTRKIFKQLLEVSGKICEELAKDVNTAKTNVEVSLLNKSEFEFQLKFGGDTLVFMMHTNIFTFEPNHYVMGTDYVKKDHMREFCGMIQVYNFLSDSIKYNREGDLGYLIARIFINKDLHFFVEGKRPLSINYNNFECCEISDETLYQIVMQSMNYCLNFDLMAPPVQMVNLLTVEQKNILSYSSGMPTGKRLGFTSHSEHEIT